VGFRSQEAAQDVTIDGLFLICGPFLSAPSR
jgi:hypothetical protein